MVMIAFYLACIVCSSMWIFLYSYFANQITVRISTMSNTAYYSKWFACPLELQKYVVLIIARSQEPIQFTGFGIVNCTLETLGKVTCTLIAIGNGLECTNSVNPLQLVKTSVSYYLIFRQLSQR